VQLSFDLRTRAQTFLGEVRLLGGGTDLSIKDTNPGPRRR
jgi:hypothetical protein